MIKDSRPALTPLRPIRRTTARYLHTLLALSWLLVIVAAPAAAEVIGEVGRASFRQATANSWHKITLNHRYQQAIVIAGPASYHGSDPLTVRVRRVTADSFEIQLDEWDYRDGPHVRETIDYLVVEAGRYTLSNGKIVAAGRIAAVDEQPQSIRFDQPFANTPVLFSQTATRHTGNAVTTRQQAISKSGFNIRLQQQQAAQSPHGTEQVHWLAIEPGAVDGLLRAGRTTRAVNHRWHSLAFADRYTSAPRLLAALQSRFGGDPASLRYRGLSVDGVRLKVEEERSADNEIWHTTEVVGYLLFTASGAIHSGSANRQPQLTGLANQRGKPGDTINLLIDAEDPDGDTLRFSATDLPTGLSIDAASGRIGGLLSNAAVGHYTTKITVSDGIAAASDTIRWTVAALNPIYQENRQPGTRDWQIQQAVNPAAPEVAGYADATSYQAGQTIHFKVSLRTAGQYRLQVYRLGYYNGDGGRRLHDSGPLLGAPQSDCGISEAATRLIECDWQTSYSLSVGDHWTSGMYVANLNDVASGQQSQVWFAVREADNARGADILFKLNFLTYLAYSNYGSDVQHSLYTFNSSDQLAAQKVSFDRPFGQVTIDPARYDNMLDYEYRMVRWLESQGYDVAYATDVDVHSEPQMLLNYGLFLSVGHDEYWSQAMRDGVETARDSGVHLAFFSANTAYWRVRFEPSSEGVANRVMACYKDPQQYPDPIAPTYRWRDAENQRPENALMGVMYVGDDVFDQFGGYDYIVSNASDPYYDHTGLVNGDALFGLVGFEWDGIVNNGFTPPGLTTLASSPTIAQGSAPGLPVGTDANRSHAVRYTATSGAKVFSSGSIQWVWALDSFDISPPRDDPAAAQFVTNVFADMDAYPLTPDTGIVVAD